MKKIVRCSRCGREVKRKELAITLKEKICQWCFIAEYNRLYNKNKEQ